MEWYIFKFEAKENKNNLNCKYCCVLIMHHFAGWYRECSIIPHTTDVDFFIRSEEYSRMVFKSNTYQ